MMESTGKLNAQQDLLNNDLTKCISFCIIICQKGVPVKHLMKLFEEHSPNEYSGNS